MSACVHHGVSANLLVGGDGEGKDSFSFCPRV